MEYQKILKPSKKLLITIVILTIIVASAMVGAMIMNSPGKDEECIVYNDLMNEGKDEEDKYVKVEIVTLPYEFAVKEENSSKERFYFVADAENYLYIARLSPKKYEEIEKKYKENPDEFKYELKGYIFNTPSELKKYAINSYNKGLPADERISYSDFQSYFGKTYLDDRITPNTEYATVLLLVGIFFSIFDLVAIIQFIISVAQTKSAIKKYGKEELESELAKEGMSAYPKAKTFITDKYVISNMSGFHVLNYEDILWIYIEKRKQRGMTVGKFILALTKQGKKYFISSSMNEDVLKEIMEKIYEKNNTVLIGYTSENSKEYKRLRNEAKKPQRL